MNYNTPYFFPNFSLLWGMLGVTGGGGGGSSFVYTTATQDYVVVLGQGHLGGGQQHDPPEAAGLGEWDKPGGTVYLYPVSLSL